MLPSLDPSILGKGGFGQVQKATIHGREVVVKLPRQGKAVTGTITYGTAMEIFCLSAMAKHAHLVELLAVSYLAYAAPSPVLIFALAEGGDLYRAKRTASVEPLHILVGAASGLSHPYANRVIHADVKPENILLAGTIEDPSRQRGVLADFGLAHRMRDGVLEVAEKSVVGTTGFQAPEVIEQKIISPAGDVYAFGVMMGVILFDQSPAGLASFARAANYGDDRSKRLAIGAIQPSPALSNWHDFASIHVKLAFAELSKLMLKCLLRERKLRPISASLVKDSSAIESGMKAHT